MFPHRKGSPNMIMKSTNKLFDVLISSYKFLDQICNAPLGILQVLLIATNYRLKKYHPSAQPHLDQSR